MFIFKHTDFQICCIRGIVGSAMDCMSGVGGWGGSGSWRYLATILHVAEKLDTCDFNKAEGSYYPQYLYI